MKDTKMKDAKMRRRMQKKLMEIADLCRTKGYVMLLLALILPAIMIVNLPVKVEAAGSDTKITKKNDDFKVSAEYGLGGYACYECPMQATVTIESSKNFSGILQIMYDEEYGGVITAYGKKITLAAGESKTYKMAVAPPTSAGGVKLAILNDREKPVYEEKTTVELTGLGEKVITGVLSDDYAGVGYINGFSLSDSYTNSYHVINTLELTKDTFPDNAQVLTMMDYLVIDNFDTSTLSEKQYEALKQWTAEGGTLILSLGSHYQNVLSGFKDDFVSGTIGDIKKRNLTWNTIEQEVSMQNVECIDFELGDGEIMSAYTADGSAWKKNYGMGGVAVLSYSLSMEPFASSTWKKNVAAAIFEEASNNIDLDARREKINDMFNTGSRLATVAESVKRPSSLLYGLLLLFYVVFVGPILYLILKKKNKREIVWIAIPITSLVFTGIIYCTSFIYRINKPLLNSFTIIRSSENSAEETVYSEVVCPSAKKYTFKINGDYSGFRNQYYQYDYSFFGNGSDSKEANYDYMYLDNGGENEVILNSDSNFDKFDFSMTRVLNEGVGEISCDLDCNINSFTGTITNNTVYDLSDVIVTYENLFYLAGDIKKGETVNVDSTKIVSSTGYGAVDSLYNYVSTADERYKLYQVNSQIENSMVDITKYNQVNVWGTVLSYKPDLMNDLQVKASGMAVIFDSFYLERSDISGNYYSSISPMIVDYQGDFDSTSGMMYGSEVTVTYSFDDYGNVVALELNKDILTYGTYADCEALNTDTGQYEPIFLNSNELSGAELSKYLSHGLLQLRFINPEYNYNTGYSEYYVPRIAAIAE